jgi:tetratricopeptide (TPR) repeat protein
MSSWTRILAVVSVAVVAALAVVTGVLLLSDDGGGSASEERPRGAPPFVLDLGVRTDPEANVLRRAAAVYRTGERRRAGEMLAGHSSLQAQVGRALSTWPEASLDRLESLARENPRSGAVQFHLGLVRFWSGDRDGALAAWRATRAGDPDSAYAVRSSDLLFRQYPPGLPVFIPSFRADPGLTRLTPRRQLAALARRARGEDVHHKLLYGLALQRIDRPLSARREYTAAAENAPNDPEALVADAVGRFDKAHPERAFSRLGPLARRYPRAATVRFHLGLLLLWLGNVEEAKRQLRLASASMKSPLSREAKRFLTRLEAVRNP